MATFGAYRSANLFPHFAQDVEDNGGPFDPEVRVQIYKSSDGRYTINGEPALNEDLTPKVYLDLRKFMNNTINGVKYVSNGVLELDSDGRRYGVYISEAAPDQPLPYSVHISFKDDPNNYHIQGFDLPQDHPFLRAFKTA